MCKQEPFSYQNPPKYRFISMTIWVRLRDDPDSSDWTKLGETFTGKIYGTCLPLRLRKDVVILLRANMGKMFALG